MAGHSKRHNIKHKKAKTDAAKGKLYSKHGKLITIAARDGGNVSLNPVLATLVAKAKREWVPNNVIDKAIAKWSGADEGWIHYTEIYYEAYGPGGSALYVRCLTENTNRSATNVKTTIQKAWWSMGNPGSVGRQFEEKGVIIVDGVADKKIIKGNEVEEVLPYDVDELELAAMEYDIDTIETEDDFTVITTPKDQFLTIEDAMIKADYHLAESELRRLPTNPVSLSDEDFQKLESMIEKLEEDEDVDTVFHNAQ